MKDYLKHISKFSGSYGLALILKNKNYLFVDGRYTLQAKNQCEKLFNSLSFNEIGIYEPNKDEIKTKKLHYKK